MRKKKIIFITALLISLFALAGSIIAEDTPVPPASPFSYNIGINYETWNRSNIPADLDNITKYFKLIHIYHDSEDNTYRNLDISTVNFINYVTANPGKGIEISLGTNNNAVSIWVWKNGKPTDVYNPGSMNDPALAKQWVTTMLSTFGGKDNFLKYVKTITLGNELDQNGPPPTSKYFNDYVNTWVLSSFGNLKQALANQGLGSIPITISIANTGNKAADTFTGQIASNWPTSWNQGKSFVFFNQYTLDNGSSTDFSHVIDYFESLQTKYNGKPEIFVGETGYSAEFNTPDSNNQALVIGKLFSWLTGQYNSNNKRTIPLFVFEAFDESSKPAGQQKMGLFQDNGTLKDGITIPDWVGKTWKN